MNTFWVYREYLNCLTQNFDETLMAHLYKADFFIQSQDKLEVKIIR